MPDRPLFTNEAALAGALAVGLSIANAGSTPALVAKLRLFDNSFVPDVGTTRAELEAAETLLVGYPAGGYDITAFSGPMFLGGGAVMTSNLVNVLYASGVAVTIGGYWVEDDATPTPKVREVFIFDPVRSLANVGDGFPVVVQLGYGANPL
jgi:hypothetical protein